MEVASGAVGQREFEFEKMYRRKIAVADMHSIASRPCEAVGYGGIAAEVEPVDYGAAGLYVVGLQAVVATVGAGVASIASCWLLPASAVSAVRTLAITATVGILIVKEPLRLGRVRGLLAMFNAMKPCVVLYIAALTIEQLVHTCVAGEARSPSLWKRLGFHAVTMAMVASGFVRARAPRSETDLPFLLTLAAVLALAVVPPPAVPMDGPLCSPPTLMIAGERLLRALLFSMLYAVHAYVAAPRANEMHELAIVVIRSGAASLWVLAVHPAVLALAPAQAGLALFARFQRCDAVDMGLGSGLGLGPPYASVDTRSDGGGSMDEIECGGGQVVISPIGHQQHLNEPEIRACASPMESCNGHANDGGEDACEMSSAMAVIHAAPPLFSDRKPHGLKFSLGPPAAEPLPSSTMSAAKLAEIASRIS